MEQKKFYKKIKNYSIYNNVILFSLFVLVLVSVVTTVVEVKIKKNYLMKAIGAQLLNY